MNGQTDGRTQMFALPNAVGNKLITVVVDECSK